MNMLDKTSFMASKLRNFVIFTLIMGASTLAFAQDDFGSAQNDAQAALENGQQLFKDGDYEAAADAFTQVIDATGGFQPAPLLMRAKAYAQLEEYEASLEDLKNALTYGQAQTALVPEILNTRAEVYMLLNAYQLALPDLQQAVQADRSQSQYQFNLGKTLAKLGGFDQAEKALTKYLDSEPEGEEEQVAEALAYRGQAFGFMGDKEESLSDFEKSLEINPENHECYFNRALVYLQDKEYGPAEADMAKSIQFYVPDDEDDENPFIQGYLTLASIQEELGKSMEDESASNAAYARCAETCSKLLDELDEEDPQLAASRAATNFRLGVAQRLMGQYGPAVNSMSIALQDNPAMGEAYFRRGICFFYLGEERLAIRDFEQAASINFDSPRSNLWKGMAWAKLGDLNEAIRAYGESISVSDRYIHAFVNRGLAHLQNGDFQKAADDFNEAIRLQPTEANHFYRRGRAYSLLGDSEKSIRSLMIAIQLDENLAKAYEAITKELAADGQSQLANEYRRRAADLGIEL